VVVSHARSRVFVPGWRSQCRWLWSCSPRQSNFVAHSLT
jgi:hypothetical protein